jgi:RNA polymerase sigma-70 factor (ECF subfamily)
LGRFHSAPLSPHKSAVPGLKSNFGQSYTAIAQMSESNSIFELAWLQPTATEPVPPRAEVEQEVLQLFDSTSDGISRYAANLGVPHHDIDDVIQEVFLALFKHLMQGSPQTHMRAWLFRVAHNLSLRHLRTQGRSRTAMQAHVEIANREADTAHNPEQQFAESQRRQRLLAVYRALPKTDQRCLALRSECLRYREISRILSMSLGAVAKSVARSIERLERADSM